MIGATMMRTGSKSTWGGWENDYTRRGMLRWIFTGRQTDAKQYDNNKITMVLSGRTTHYSQYSSCTGRCRAAATTYHPAQSMKLCLSAGETTVHRSEQEKWERGRSNHACSIPILSHYISACPHRNPRKLTGQRVRDCSVTV